MHRSSMPATEDSIWPRARVKGIGAGFKLLARSVADENGAENISSGGQCMAVFSHFALNGAP